ncbi:hypothetical protein TrLO_g3610 [Triparma laevis f. longispina]|uniref:HNH nuclease domain-containing protein n=1 Tax=Triparma laevis f. longispina TaxID=1714387 RepID=A0A9W7EJQ8_9STRA|nr:hypothetical protein TrLO_g3610 [Triparma laevis f. longispina]
MRTPVSTKALLLLLAITSGAFVEGYRPGRGPGSRVTRKKKNNIPKHKKKFQVVNNSLNKQIAHAADVDSVPLISTGLPYSSYPALVLNADYQPLSLLPLSLWSWQESIKAVFSGRVSVVDSYDYIIRGVGLSVPLPSVIALHDYIPEATQKSPAFTRRNIFLRDDYKCQYCSSKFAPRDLTLDHVVPRCEGGRLEWKNAVSCCRVCNGRKGCKSLKECENIGMKLRRNPTRPTMRELNTKAGKLLPRLVHESWKPYLEHSWGDERGKEE